MQLALIDPEPTDVELSAAPGWGLVAIGVATAVLLTIFVRRASRAPALQRWARWFNPIVVATWLALTWLAAQRILGTGAWPKITARAALLVVLLAIAAPLLRDLLASVLISFEGRHRVGDDIRVAGLEGRVIALGLRSVVLQRRDGSECAIPNSRFAASEVVRLNLPSGEAPCEFEVVMPPGLGVEAASAELVEAALLSPFAAPGSLPEVFVVAGEGAELRLRVRAFVFDRIYEERYRSDILARLTKPVGGSVT